MITDTKKVLVKMSFRNYDVLDFKRSADVQSDEPFDEELSEGEYDIDVDIEQLEENENEGEGKPVSGTRIVSEGYIYKKDNRITLRYAEADSTDLANELTIISFEDGEPGIVTMERNGVCRTVMVFEEGKRYLSMYTVSGMSMDLTVRTYELENTLTLEDGGNIRLGYTLENGGATVSSVKMLLEIELI